MPGPCQGLVHSREADISTPATWQMNPKDAVLSEISRSQKDTEPVAPPRRGPWRRQIYGAGHRWEQGRGRWGPVFNGARASVWGDDRVLEADGSGEGAAQRWECAQCLSAGHLQVVARIHLCYVLLYHKNKAKENRTISWQKGQRPWNVQCGVRAAHAVGLSRPRSPGWGIDRSQRKGVPRPQGRAGLQKSSELTCGWHMQKPGCSEQGCPLGQVVGSGALWVPGPLGAWDIL